MFGDIVKHELRVLSFKLSSLAKLDKLWTDFNVLPEVRTIFSETN